MWGSLVLPCGAMDSACPGPSWELAPGDSLTRLPQASALRISTPFPWHTAAMGWPLGHPSQPPAGPLGKHCSRPRLRSGHSHSQAQGQSSCSFCSSAGGIYQDGRGRGGEGKKGLDL